MGQFFCLVLERDVSHLDDITHRTYPDKKNNTVRLFLFYSREVLKEVLDTDLSNEAFPFSTHKIASAAGHQVISHTQVCISILLAV